MHKLKSLIKKAKEYNKLANIDEIGRRYFAMNSFDGILTIMGILVGSFFAKIVEPKIIISTGFAASIAMAVSGMWGTYLTEDAERKKKLHDLGKHTLREMHSTKLGKAERFASIVVSFIDGIAPFLAAIIVISPFFFISVLDITTAYLTAIGLAFMLLMALGAFLGHISKENLIKSGLKMVFAGIVCMGLITLFGVT